MSDTKIIDALKSDKPVMIARFGSTEIKTVLYGKYPKLLFFLKDFIFKRITTNSGFFNCNEKQIKMFTELMLEDMQLVDILGSWRKEELFFKKYLKDAKKIPLREIEPYFSEVPWSKVLEGKKVLVIHPFSKTIEEQYKNNRLNLFKNKDVLPKFKSLQTIKAVQTLAGEKSSFKTWFDALNFMKKQVDALDFDIAIIGCGAYGFPLAAHVKRIGKKAVHMGGATQMLFGIKGKRWEKNENFSDIINSYFVSPSKEDFIKGAENVEGGCYW